MMVYRALLHTLSGILLCCALALGLRAESQASRTALEHALHLYEGIWTGSIDLTSYHGQVLMSLEVRMEYRLIRQGDQPILLGRLDFGDRGARRHSRLVITLADGFLVNRIEQEGQETLYHGMIEGDRIAWKEQGKEAALSSSYFERFVEHADSRAMISQSRNILMEPSGDAITVFTAGRFRYAGNPTEQSLESWWGAPALIDIRGAQAWSPPTVATAPTTPTAPTQAVPAPSAAEQQLSDLRRDYDTLRKERDQAAAELAELRAQASRLAAQTGEVEPLRVLVAQRDAELQGLREQLATLQARVQELNTAVASRDAELTASEAARRELVSQQASLESRLQALETDIQEKSGASAQMREALAKAQAELSGVEAGRHELVAKSERFEADARASRKASEALAATLAEKQNELQALSAARDAIRQERDRMFAALEEERTRAADLANQVAEARQLKTAVAQRDEELKGLRQEMIALNQEREARLKEWETRLEASNASQAQLASALEKTQAELVTLRQARDAVSDERDRAVAELSDLRARSQQLAEQAGEGEQLQAEVLRREAEIQDLQQAVAGLQEQVREREATLAGRDESLQELQGAKQELMALNQEREAQLKEWETRLEASNASQAQLASALEKTQAELVTLRQARDAVSDERDRAVAELSDLRARSQQLAEQAGEGEQLQAEVLRREAEIQDLREAVADLRTRLGESEALAESRELKLQESLLQADRANEAEKKLLASLELRDSELADLRAEVAVLRDKTGELDELVSVRERLAESEASRKELIAMQADWEARSRMADQSSEKLASTLLLAETELRELRSARADLALERDRALAELQEVKARSALESSEMEKRYLTLIAQRDSELQALREEVAVLRSRTRDFEAQALLLSQTQDRMAAMEQRLEEFLAMRAAPVSAVPQAEVAVLAPAVEVPAPETQPVASYTEPVLVAYQSGGSSDAAVSVPTVAESTWDLFEGIDLERASAPEPAPITVASRDPLPLSEVPAWAREAYLASLPGGHPERPVPSTPPARPETTPTPVITPVAGSFATAATPRPSYKVYRNHRVRDGETLPEICMIHGASLRNTMLLNGLTTVGDIRPGQVLLLRVSS